MKKILIACSLMLCVFSFSCNNLDLLPISAKSVEGFYTNEQEIRQAVNACYNTLGSILVRNNYSYWLTEARSDNTFQGMGYDDGPINRFTETATLPTLATVWADHYNLIFQSNKILEALATIDLTEEKRTQFEGEAKFFRALSYFNLVRFFGDVPLIMKSLTLNEGYSVSRNSTQEVYQQIESDLIDASGLLPIEYPANDYGRVTRWAAKGMLGKVYVFQSGYPLELGKWEDARLLFREIIESGRFSFFDNYADIFSYEHETGNQSLFSIKFTSGASNGNPFPTRNAPNDIANRPLEEGGIPFGGSPSNIFISEDFITSFEEGDIRKDVSIQFEWVDRSGNIRNDLPFVRKYLNGPIVSGARDWDVDWIVLRYTEILMLYAECLNELSYTADGEALEILNQVRERANLNPWLSSDIENQDDFRLKMETERRHEFCFENIRWFDLVRTDRALDVMSDFLEQYGLEANFQNRNRYLFPIPQKEINMNKNLTQNTGY